MRFPLLLILLPTLVLVACGKKDLEAESEEPIPEAASAPARSAPTPKLPTPPASNPFRTPDVTSKLPDSAASRTTPILAPDIAPNDSATVTVRPPTTPSPSDGNE